MSTRTTSNDAVGAASTQVSLGEVLDDFDVEEPAEKTEPEIDPSVDLTTEVCVGKGRDHYHVIRIKMPDGGVVSACPHKKHEVITLKEAIESEATPCGVCEPIDWRADTDANATEGQ
jgi:hypothetical protein